MDPIVLSDDSSDDDVVVTEVKLKKNKLNNRNFKQTEKKNESGNDSDGSDIIFVASSRAKLNRQGNATVVLSLKPASVSDDEIALDSAVVVNSCSVSVNNEFIGQSSMQSNINLNLDCQVSSEEQQDNTPNLDTGNNDVTLSMDFNNHRVSSTEHRLDRDYTNELYADRISPVHTELSLQDKTTDLDGNATDSSNDAEFGIASTSHVAEGSEHIEANISPMFVVSNKDFHMPTKYNESDIHYELDYKMQTLLDPTDMNKNQTKNENRIFSNTNGSQPLPADNPMSESSGSIKSIAIDVMPDSNIFSAMNEGSGSDTSPYQIQGMVDPANSVDISQHLFHTNTSPGAFNQIHSNSETSKEFLNSSYRVINNRENNSDQVSSKKQAVQVTSLSSLSSGANYTSDYLDDAEFEKFMAAHNEHNNKNEASSYIASKDLSGISKTSSNIEFEEPILKTNSVCDGNKKLKFKGSSKLSDKGKGVKSKSNTVNNFLGYEMSGTAHMCHTDDLGNNGYSKKCKTGEDQIHLEPGQLNDANKDISINDYISGTKNNSPPKPSQLIESFSDHSSNGDVSLNYNQSSASKYVAKKKWKVFKSVENSSDASEFSTSVDDCSSDSDKLQEGHNKHTLHTTATKIVIKRPQKPGEGYVVKRWGATKKRKHLHKVKKFKLDMKKKLIEKNKDYLFKIRSFDKAVMNPKIIFDSNDSTTSNTKKVIYPAHHVTNQMKLEKSLYSAFITPQSDRPNKSFVPSPPPPSCKPPDQPSGPTIDLGKLMFDSSVTSSITSNTGKSSDAVPLQVESGFSKKYYQRKQKLLQKLGLKNPESGNSRSGNTVQSSWKLRRFSTGNLQNNTTTFDKTTKQPINSQSIFLDTQYIDPIILPDTDEYDEFMKRKKTKNNRQSTPLGRQYSSPNIHPDTDVFMKPNVSAENNGQYSDPIILPDTDKYEEFMKRKKTKRGSFFSNRPSTSLDRQHSGPNILPDTGDFIKHNVSAENNSIKKSSSLDNCSLPVKKRKLQPFSVLSSLSLPVAVSKNEDESKICVKCCKRFNSLASYTLHMQRVHGNMPVKVFTPNSSKVASSTTAPIDTFKPIVISPLKSQTCTSVSHIALDVLSSGITSNSMPNKVPLSKEAFDASTIYLKQSDSLDSASVSTHSSTMSEVQVIPQIPAHLESRTCFFCRQVKTKAELSSCTKNHYCCATCLQDHAKDVLLGKKKKVPTATLR